MAGDQASHSPELLKHAIIYIRHALHASSSHFDSSGERTRNSLLAEIITHPPTLKKKELGRSAVKSYFCEKQRKLNDYNLACDYSVLL